MDALFLREIKKAYTTSMQKENNFLLCIDELKIHEGEFFGLIGASGCGKTTLLKIIAGLYAVDEGRVSIGDCDITKISAEKRGLGMVFQEALLFPHMTIEQNVAFGLKIQKMDKQLRKKKVKEILEVVGLKGFESRYPSELSGGQQQRVAIARAIVCTPKILLMDEPFSALDPTLREEMRILVSDIHKKYRITIVFVTHDREEAFALFDRMAIMKDGRIVQIGSPQELYQQPANVYSAQFLGVKNIFYGKVEKKVFAQKTLKIHLSNTANDSQCGYVMMRPETLEVIKMKREDITKNITETDIPILWGRIKDDAFQQGFLFLKVQVGEHIFSITQKSPCNQLFHIGEEVGIKYDPRQIWFIKDHDDGGTKC
ncbi:ABC transporter ATP-binding protein [Clostridiaceae bacterium 35-E11]